MTASDRVRLDKWLWAARFYKSRSMAAQAIDLGRVRLGGERVRPAREVRAGDRIEVVRGAVHVEVEVRALSTVRGPTAAAQLLYEETRDSVGRRERRSMGRPIAPEPALSLRGRPTKREGRALRRLRGSQD